MYMSFFARDLSCSCQVTQLLVKVSESDIKDHADTSVYSKVHEPQAEN